MAEGLIHEEDQDMRPNIRTIRRAGRTAAVAALFAATFTGCGGGGGGSVADVPAPATAPSPAPAPAPVPAPSVAGAAEGLWREDTGSFHRYALVEADGQFWGIPSVNFFGNSDLEVYKGAAAAASGNATGTFKDVATKGCELLYTCTMSGVASGSKLTVSAVQSSSGHSIPLWSFDGNKDSSYSTQAAVSQVSGTWNATAVMPANFNATGQLTVGSSGEISVLSVGGCSFTGSIAPVSGKGYFRLTLSSVGGACATNVTASQVTGVAFKTTVTGVAPVLHVMWHNPSLSQFFWSSGVK